MKIRIKEFRGVPVSRGFFPIAGLRVKPKEVYECQSEEEFKRCMDTGQVEVVPDDSPVTERLLERKQVLDGAVTRHRDVIQEQLKAQNQGQMTDLEATNQKLMEMVRNLTARIDSMETPPMEPKEVQKQPEPKKRGRPKKNESSFGA